MPKLPKIPVILTPAPKPYAGFLVVALRKDGGFLHAAINEFEALRFCNAKGYKAVNVASAVGQLIVKQHGVH